jgi:hypothetical protein
VPAFASLLSSGYGFLGQDKGSLAERQESIPALAIIGPVSAMSAAEGMETLASNVKHESFTITNADNCAV